MRILRAVLRLVGWLLTPLVAWAASFAGAWLGAAVGGEFTRSTTALWVTFGFGAACGLGAAWAWLRLLRRSPRLRETLSVTPEGTPLVAIEDEPPKGAP